MFYKKRSVHFCMAIVTALTALATISAKAQNKTSVSFKSTVQYGTQKNNVAVLISSDFSGEYTLSAIKKAVWKDITGMFNLASNKEPAESGEVVISKDPGAQYIAIRYIGEPSARPAQRAWAIMDLTFKKGGDAFSPVWQIVNDSQNNPGAGWFVGNNKIQYKSNQSLIRNESWAITPVKDQ